MARLPEQDFRRERRGRFMLSAVGMMPEIRLMGEWETFRTQVEQEGKGGIVWFNHSSKADLLALIKLLALLPDVSTPIMAPIALHQQKAALTSLVNRSNAVLCPLITAHTIEKYQKKGLPIPDKKEYRNKYANTAVEVLKKGGIVLVDPQGERQKYLRIPKMPATSLLARKIKDSGLEDNIVNICVGLTFRNPSRLNKSNSAGKYHLFSRMEARFGPVFPLSDISQARRQDGERHADAHARVIMERLAALLPKEQRGDYSIQGEPPSDLTPTKPKRRTILFCR